MNPELNQLDLEFALQARPTARVDPDGFLIGTTRAPVLVANIRAWSLGRKHFRKSKLVCWSADGAHGSGGKRCEACHSRGDCTPRIRLLLERCPAADPGPAPEPKAERLTLELNYTSCRNFLDYARLILGTDGDLARVPTRLTVVPQDHWGEVRFEVDPDLFYPADPPSGAPAHA